MVKPKKKVAVIGLWHLGCTVAVSLASKGYKVFGIDFESKAIGELNRGILPLFEPGLEELTKRQLRKGNLSFTNDFKNIKKCDYVVIAYDTPVDNKDRPDLNIVLKAFGRIKKFIKQDGLLIVMSQVPAGTCRKFYQTLQKSKKKAEVAYNPENVRLGNAISTYLDADRQIIGLSSAKTKSLIKKFYSFYKKPLLFMSLESAELVKHSINAFLATSVSFINQIADLSEKLRADISEVVKGLKSDSRIGKKAFLSPGLGFAGGTLGRDLKVLNLLASKYGVALPLIKDVYTINQNRKRALYNKIFAIYPRLKGKKAAIFGLVYKPGTSTLRRSLALEIAQDLIKQGATVSAFDPALKEGKQDLKGIKLENSPYTAAKNADFLVIVTEWPEFKFIDYKKLGKRMRQRVVFDTKNILGKQKLLKLKFDYHGTGI